jgi:hypothetical protein
MLDRVLSFYRLHGGGIWTGATPWLNIARSHQTWALLDEHLDYQYTREITKGAITYARKESCNLAAHGRLADSCRVWYATVKRYFPRKATAFVFWAIALLFYRCRREYFRLTKTIAIRSRVRRLLAGH